MTLSTDDPLLFHMSDDALLEEYSVARATFDLSMTDLMVSSVCESSMYFGLHILRSRADHFVAANKRKLPEILFYNRGLRKNSNRNTWEEITAEVSLIATNTLHTFHLSEPSSEQSI